MNEPPVVIIYGVGFTHSLHFWKGESEGGPFLFIVSLSVPYPPKETGASENYLVVDFLRARVPGNKQSFQAQPQYR